MKKKKTQKKQVNPTYLDYSSVMRENRGYAAALMNYETAWTSS